MDVRTTLERAGTARSQAALALVVGLGCAVAVAATAVGTARAWPDGAAHQAAHDAAAGEQPAVFGDHRTWADADAPQLGVAAVAEFTLREGAENSVTDAFAHRVLLDQEVFAYPNGAGAGGLESGIGIIGLPRLMKQISFEPRSTTKIVVTNMSRRPGFTDFVIGISDQNGLLDYVGEKLNERQTEFIDLETWGYVNDGFVGSAFISAVFWEHDVYDDDGELVRNTLGLSASVADWSTSAGSHPGAGSALRAVPYDTSLGVPIVPWKIDRPPFLWSGPSRPRQPSATPGPSPTASATPTVTPTPTTTPTPLVQPPYAPDSPELLLPALAWRSADARCDAELAVQNAGGEQAVGALVTWGESGECGAAGCAGPLAVTCTVAIDLDARWTIRDGDLPDEARSGVLFSFSTRTMSELGLGQSDAPVASVMCGMLAATLPGNCLEYERFKRSFDQGLDYNGLPLDRAWGSPLAVQVTRQCDGPNDGPGLPLASSYAGVWGPNIGHRDFDDSVLAYALPIIHGTGTDRPSVAHVQNAGDGCASFEVKASELGELGAGAPPVDCAALELEAGAAAMVDVSGCVSESGSAWIESDEPLAVVVDSTDELAMSSYVGAPPQLTDMHRRPLLSASGAVALAPGVYANYMGWNTEITAQNTGAITSVFRISVIDRNGDEVSVRQLGPVAPRSAVAVDVATLGDVPSVFVGNLLIESFPLAAAPVATPWLGPEATALPPPTRPPGTGPPWYDPTRTPGLPVPVTPGTQAPSPTPSATVPPGPTPTPLRPTVTPVVPAAAIYLPLCVR